MGLKLVAPPVTPGRAAHDTWCADDDWAVLSADERQLWEDAAQAAIAAAAIKEG
jgi:hypothetical protein